MIIRRQAGFLRLRAPKLCGAKLAGVFEIRDTALAVFAIRSQPERFLQLNPRIEKEALKCRPYHA
jgi:hypothetical protein